MSEGPPWTRAVIRSVAKKPGVRIYQYSVPEDFQDLWSLSGSTAPDDDMFIIWDGMPALEGSSELGLEDHLTVFDWVIGVGLDAASQVQKGGPAPNLRVHVLNAVRRAQMPGAFGLKATSIVENLAPWVRVHPFTAHGANEFAAAINSSPAGMPSLGKVLASSRGRENHNMLRRIWVSELTRTDLRHSLANAIGPVLLARELMHAGLFDAGAYNSIPLVNPPSAGPRAPFLALLERLKLLETDSDAARSSDDVTLGQVPDLDFVQADLFGRFHNLRFALVDDQCWAGYHSALEAFLLTESSRSSSTAGVHHLPQRRWSLTSFDAPEMLLAWLERTKRHRGPNNWFAPRVFGKAVLRPGTQPLDDSSLPEFDILLLDLRLFGIADQASEKAAEQLWLGRLIGFSKSIEKSIATVPPNQAAAFRKALDAAQRQFDGEERHVRQLALLPILISLCDPTTPIILFSSSQQRAVLDLLRPFSNVITDFSKPALTGYGGEDREALRRSAACLRAALHAALQLHERRLVWEIFSNWTRYDFTLPPCILLDAEARKKQREFGNKYKRLPKHKSEIYGSVQNASRPSFHEAVSPSDFMFLVDVARKFCTDADLLDTLIQPAEFTEAVLQRTYRLVGSDVEFSFHKRNIEISQGNLSKAAAARVQAAQAVRLARNQAAHGYLIPNRAKLAAYPQAVESVLILHILSVAKDDRAIDILKTIVEPNDLLHAVLVYYGREAPAADETSSEFVKGVYATSALIWPRLFNPAPRTRELEETFFREHNLGDFLDGTVIDVNSDYVRFRLENAVDAYSYRHDWSAMTGGRKFLRIGDVVHLQITALKQELRRIEVDCQEQT